MDGLTIGNVLREIAKVYPENESLVFSQSGYSLTYKQYDQIVDDVAKGLISLGMEHGDHIALWATNIPEWPILMMATARIGAVLVNINPAYGLNGLEYALKQCDMKALFLVDGYKSSNYFEMLESLCPELKNSKPGKLKSRAFPLLKWVVAINGEPLPGMIDWNQLIDSGKVVDDSTLTTKEHLFYADDLANIQYTSGTTGRPKATMLSHRNILLNAYYVTECQNITENDKICVPVPFYHCFGCVLGILGALVRGATLVSPSAYFDPNATFKAIDKEKATVIYGVPTMFVAMLEEEDFNKYNLTSLRTGIMAGAPCPEPLMNEVMSRMNTKEMTIAYGLTEASPVITQTRTDDAIDIRVQTIGKPIPGVEVKIADLKTNEALEPKQIGELCTRGHNVMLGYYKNSEATEKTIDKDGWLHSGDLAKVREDGYYEITGRIKDIIIRGGENIYPDEIEAFLLTHTAIEQVAIVGVPDKKYGEELCAWIKLRKGQKLLEGDLKAFCKGQIAHYKIPKYIRFVDEFPLTVTGKIQKFKIREQMEKELGTT